MHRELNKRCSKLNCIQVLLLEAHGGCLLSCRQAEKPPCRSAHRTLAASRQAVVSPMMVVDPVSMQYGMPTGKFAAEDRARLLHGALHAMLLDTCMLWTM